MLRIQDEDSPHSASARRDVARTAGLRPVRILIANYEFPPLGGGASKASFELALALARQGHEVSVLTAGEKRAAATEKIHGIVVHRVWSWRKGIHDCGLRGALTFLIAALPRLRRLLKTGDFDVIHYFFGLPTGLLSLYSRGVAGVPYIVSLRGSDVPLYDRESFKLKVLHRLTRGLSRRIWARASEVFAVSHALRRLAEESFPEVKIRVVYNGVERIASGDREAGAHGPHGREGLVRLTCVSRLIARKGVADLIEAMALLGDLDVSLTIMGTGPEQQALGELASRRGLSERVAFRGYASTAVVRAENLRSDIFVLPTHSEAFANVILEAMSAGLPVVASRVGGVPEAVIDGKTGVLVNPGQPEQLAAAIRTLAEDPDLRRALGSAGRERAGSLFTWEDAARGYTQAYRRTAARSSALLALETDVPHAQKRGD